MRSYASDVPHALVWGGASHATRRSMEGFSTVATAVTEPTFRRSRVT